MKIGIVTDSTCDLPPETIARLGIEVVPLHINMGGNLFFDGVNLTKEEFYRRLPAYDPTPTTATPGAEAFIQRFEALAKKGVDAILSIHISESLSATINSARLAAAEFTQVPVTVLDSSQLSLGTGFLVERAAIWASEELDLDKIVEKIKSLMPRTYVFAALDTLEYLRRSGRMHIALARFGEILRLKPLLFMNQGDSQAHPVRTSKKAIARLFYWLDKYGPFEQLAVVHADAQEQAETLRVQASRYLTDGKIIIQQITPVLGSHLGLGAIGFAGIAKKR